MINKKGAEKLISVYWFAILVLVAGGIYGMVYVFYSNPFDVRITEADLLANAVADCISDGGRLSAEVFVDGKVNPDFAQNFTKICKLNLKTENDFDWDKVPQYYIWINFLSIGKRSLGEIEEGNPRWLEYCELGSEEYKIFSQCSNKRFYILDKDVQILVDVVTAVSKTEKNVKT